MAMRIYTPDGTAPDGNGDGQKWRTVLTVIFVAGISSALFTAGMSFGGVRDAAAGLSKHIEDGDRTYVRKDGQELEAIRGELRLMNEKIDRIDRLLRQKE